MSKTKSSWIRRSLIVAVLIVIVGAISVVGWWHLFRKVPVTFASDEDHFKYGSIGMEENSGVPYWLWLVMPRIFPDKLPGPETVVG